MRELELRPPQECSRCHASALQHTEHRGYTRWWFGKSLCTPCLIIRAAWAAIITAFLTGFQLLLTLPSVRPRSNPQSSPIAKPTSSGDAAPTHVDTQRGDAGSSTSIPTQTATALTGSARPDQDPPSAHRTDVTLIPPARPKPQISSTAQPSHRGRRASETRIDALPHKVMSVTAGPPQTAALTKNDQPDDYPTSHVQSSTIAAADPAAQTSAPHTNVTLAEAEQSTPQTPPDTALLPPAAGQITPTFQGTVEVVAKEVKGIPEHAQPIGTLTALQAPETARSYMSTRCVVLAVTISRLGEARVSVVDRGGIAELFVRAAIRDASRPWAAARDGAGQKTTETRIVRYCW